MTMAVKTLVKSDQPICIKIGTISVIVRKLDRGKAHVVVVDAPRDAPISISNSDMPPCG